jgi:hypothetical protein
MKSALGQKRPLSSLAAQWLVSANSRHQTNTCSTLCIASSLLSKVKLWSIAADSEAQSLVVMSDSPFRLVEPPDHQVSIVAGNRQKLILNSGAASN